MKTVKSMERSRFQMMTRSRQRQKKQQNLQLTQNVAYFIKENTGNVLLTRHRPHVTDMGIYLALHCMQEISMTVWHLMHCMPG